MSKEKANEAAAAQILAGLNPGMLQDVLPYHAYQMYKGLSKYADADLQEISLERSSFRLVLLIHANPDVPQGKLAQALNLERSSIVPAINKLVSNGLVERRSHPIDGRSKTLHLTAEGIEVAEKIKTLLKKREKKIFANFTAAERKLFLSLMQRATVNIWALTGDE